jgi:hypothetical protein
MGRDEKAALGFSVHTGWAACVIAGGSVREPRLLARERVEILGDADRFVFHAAAEMSPADGRRSVARCEKIANERAGAALGQLLDRARAAGLAVRACAIVAKDGAMAPFEEIVAAHPRIHTGEGRFYRDVLRSACEARGLAARVIPPAQVEAAAGRAMRTTPAALAAELAAVARAVGRPWARDQRLAALAAWTVLLA